MGQIGRTGDARAPSRKEVGAVYGAGLLQGLALVTFPAASSVFTDRAAHALTSAEYGGMFVPQTIMAIGAALLGARIEHRWGEKRVFLAGLLANLASMALLAGSRFALGAHAVAFTLLLVATALMGTGFWPHRSPRSTRWRARSSLAASTSRSWRQNARCSGWGPRWRRSSSRSSSDWAPGGA